MRKWIASPLIAMILLALTFFSFTFLGPSAGAVDPFENVCQGRAADSPACSQEEVIENPITGPNGVLTRAIAALSTVAGVAAVIVIIISGFRYVTSSGDPNTTNAAKNTIVFAIIGLVIAVFARTLLVFVLGKL